MRTIYAPLLAAALSLLAATPSQAASPATLSFTLYDGARISRDAQIWGYSTGESRDLAAPAGSVSNKTIALFNFAARGTSQKTTIGFVGGEKLEGADMLIVTVGAKTARLCWSVDGDYVADGDVLNLAGYFNTLEAVTVTAVK